jgi:hypothetical protein
MHRTSRMARSVVGDFKTCVRIVGSADNEPIRPGRSRIDPRVHVTMRSSLRVKQPKSAINSRHAWKTDAGRRNEIKRGMH